MDNKKTKIVFFGDSITEGCFDIIRINGQIEILRDKPSGYVEKFILALRQYETTRQIDYLNMGVSGDGTLQALERIDKDVLEYKPDIAIVCFGLNDCSRRDSKWFANNLRLIFSKLKQNNIKIVVLTPNMFNKYVDPETVEELVDMAADCAELQNKGEFDKYIDAMREVAKEFGCYLVDAYAKWKELDRYGVDTTALLCNHINHPSRKMHLLFSDLLMECFQKNKILD